MDRPDQRRVNPVPIPRGGGLAAAAAFVLVAVARHRTTAPPVGRSGRRATSGTSSPSLGGGALAALLGVLDDFFDLRARWQLLAQLVLAFLVVALGIGVDVVNNPFGPGVIRLEGVFEVAFTVVWVLGMINSINFIDGLDGLSSGVTIIAAVTLGLISLAFPVDQPQVAIFCFAFAGAVLGFLRWNFHPAAVFAGTSGVFFFGYTLALLSILGTAKIAVALLVLGMPIIDTFWIIVRRLAAGRSPFSPDRGHIHHRLLDLGLRPPADGPRHLRHLRRHGVPHVPPVGHRADVRLPRGLPRVRARALPPHPQDARGGGPVARLLRSGTRRRSRSLRRVAPVRAPDGAAMPRPAGARRAPRRPGPEPSAAVDRPIREGSPSVAPRIRPRSAGAAPASAVSAGPAARPAAPEPIPPPAPVRAPAAATVAAPPAPAAVAATPAAAPAASLAPVPRTVPDPVWSATPVGASPARMPRTAWRPPGSRVASRSRRPAPGVHPATGVTALEARVRLVRDASLVLFGAAALALAAAVVAPAPPTGAVLSATGRPGGGPAAAQDGDPRGPALSIPSPVPATPVRGASQGPSTPVPAGPSASPTP